MQPLWLNILTPEQGLLRIGNIEGVFGVTGFAQSQVVQRATAGAQCCGDPSALVAMRPMGPPRADHHIGPVKTRLQHRHIVCPFGIRCGAHVAWVGGAIGKDICGLKTAKPQRPRTSFAAFDGGVVLDLCCLGGVQHHEHHLLPLRLPDPGQAVAICFAIGIERGGGCIALNVMTCDHGAGFGASRGEVQLLPGAGVAASTEPFT